MALPGEIRTLQDDEDYVCCNEDCVAPATHSFCVEADSFGAEYDYYCEDHISDIARNQTTEIGDCEWCRVERVPIRPTRDFEEGLHGRVYWVCDSCRHQQAISNIEDDDDVDDDDDYDD